MSITLHKGDCLVEMGKVAAGSVDLILCDLPYGTTQNKWDAVIPFPPLWVQYRRVLKPCGVIALMASQPFTAALVMSNPDWFRHEWVWIKNRGSNFLNVKREPMKEHETVVVFGAGRWTFNRQMQERTGGGRDMVGTVVIGGRTKSDNYGGYAPKPTRLSELRVPSSWQKFNTQNGFHPTQKPVALMEYMIRTYTMPGATVMDNCMGSGTTGVACVNTRRKFIGIEQNDEYFEVARRRIAEAQESLYRRSA